MEEVLSLYGTNLNTIMQNCYGTEHYYSNKYLSFKYTDGIKTFCDKAKAYWLLDIIESIVKTEPRMKGDLVSISLMVNDDKTALITFSDSNGIFYQQSILYTDCPFGEWQFYYENNVFFWHNEY